MDDLSDADGLSNESDEDDAAAAAGEAARDDKALLPTEDK